MSFECPHCGLKNSEVQPAGEIQPRGAKITFRVETAQDLSRQVVKSDTCIFRIEDIDLEIPPGRGQMTNTEGIISMIQSDLEQKQPERKEQVPELYEQLEGILWALKQMSSGDKFPFTILVNDPAGNSWIEPSETDKGNKYLRNAYDRTPAQNEALGLGSGVTNGEAAAPPAEIRPEYHSDQLYQAPTRPETANVDAEEDIIENQVYSFPASCPGCTNACTTNMKMVNIPFFKQVVLMSTVCDHCGYRSNEVKTGGEVPEKGKRIVLIVNTKEDLSRDILKSESCHMDCPELGLSVQPGTMGGRFTTVEGLLTQVRDDLHRQIFDGDDEGGDSMEITTRQRWTAFFSKLNAAMSGEITFTIILQDPLASSYVQSFTAPAPDEKIKVEEYDRTDEEEEDLGLKDIKTEGYEAPEQAPAADEDLDPEVERKRQEVIALTNGTGAAKEDSSQANGK